MTDSKVKITLLNQDKIKEYLGTKTDFSFKDKSDRIALSFQVEDVEQACQYLQEKGIETVRPPWNVVDCGIKLAFISLHEKTLASRAGMNH